MKPLYRNFKEVECLYSNIVRAIKISKTDKKFNQVK